MSEPRLKCTNIGCANEAGPVTMHNGTIEALCPACRVVLRAAYDVTCQTSMRDLITPPVNPSGAG